MFDTSILHNFPQWEKYNKDLEDNQFDDGIWDALVSHHEKLIHDHKSLLKSRRELKELIYRDMDILLTKFPYYTLYWSRYANMVYTLDGLIPSIAVYSRAVLVFPYSLDLWKSYVNILLANNVKSDNELKEIFLEGCDKVGYHFLAHEYWDKYLEWTKSKYGVNSLDYMKILVKVVKVPLHQYAKYTEEFKRRSCNFAATDLIERHELINIITKKDPSISENCFDDYIDSNSQGLIDEYFGGVLQGVQIRSQDKWKYESKITQDFNLKILSNEDLATWIAYLEYELSFHTKRNAIKNNAEVITLYERALIPSCLSETIWIKYLRYLIQHGDNESQIILNFNKACEHFVSLDQKDVRYMYIRYMELKLGNIESCKSIFITMVEKLPTDTEVVSKYVEFLFRYTKRDNIDDFIGSLINIVENFNLNADIGHKQKKNRNAVDIESPIISQDLQMLSKLLNFWTVGQLLVNACKYLWMKKNDLKKVRDILFRFLSTEATRSCKPYWYFYYKFESTQRNKSNLTHIIDALGTNSSLPIYDINFLINEYNDFIMKNMMVNETDQYQRHIIKNFLETDIESSMHMKHFLKARLLGINKNEEEIIHKKMFRENGHPAAVSEGRPTLTNPISVSQNTFTHNGAYPLPRFRNVEKANSSVRYIHESI